MDKQMDEQKSPVFYRTLPPLGPLPKKNKKKKRKKKKNKAGYTATPVACGWAGAVIEVN